MKLTHTFALAISAGITLSGGPSALAHEHLAVGANSTTPGSPLIFANAADFGSDSGYVFNLDAAEAGSPQEGWYYTGDLSLIALAATLPYGGPDPQAAALGSHLEAVVETVNGPAGASFGFWEAGPGGTDGTNLTWALSVGLSNGTNHIVISETDGSPGVDPYGHIHGRSYGVNLPGFYTVGFRFVDTSTNGPGGGPIQSPSDRFYLYFQAELTIAGISVATNHVSLSFAAPSNVPDEDPEAPPTSYQLESSPVLGSAADWQPAGDPVVGDDHLHVVTLPQTNAAAFFRLKPIEP